MHPATAAGATGTRPGASSGRPGSTPAAQASLSLSPDLVLIGEGQAATVQVQAAIATTLGAWAIDITYDPTVVKVTNCAPSTAATVLCNTGFKPNTVRLTGISASGLSGTQVLAGITFQAVARAGAATDLGVTFTSLADVSGAALTGTAIGGRISITRTTR